MKRVKIAHIITDLDVGGAELMLLKVLRNWEDKKYEHFVISLIPIGSVGEKIKKEGFKVHTLGVTKCNFISPFIKLFSILKKEKPLIAFTYLFHAEMFGRITGKLLRIPVVSSLRNKYYGTRFKEFCMWATSFCVTRYVAVSRTMALARPYTRRMLERQENKKMAEEYLREAKKARKE